MTPDVVSQGERTDWFFKSGWGVSVHYLADGASHAGAVELSTDDWNRRVDSFDVERFASQLASTGAEYCLFTIGQNAGFYCAPNATYEVLTGVESGKCSRRDLIAELAGVLRPRGIRLLAYLPSGAPTNDAKAYEKLEWQWGFQEPWPGGHTRTGARLESFQRKWESVIREWSLRWGEDVSGWLFDGCYFSEEMYRHADEPNFHSFAAAARAGNADAIIAFNAGEGSDKLAALTDAEDFTVGECNEPENVACSGRWVVGEGGHREQFHLWSYLGKWWGEDEKRFDDGQTVSVTRGITNRGGVLTWDIPVTPEGNIPDEFLTQLKHFQFR